MSTFGEIKGKAAGHGIERAVRDGIAKTGDFIGSNQSADGRD